MTRLHITTGISALLAAAALSAPAGAQVVINEIRIDQPSTDTDEYVELCGPVGFDLAGLTYVVLGDGAGGSGTIEEALALSGTIPASGLFLIGETSPLVSFPAVLPDMLAALNFENSDNVTHLIVSGFTGAAADDLDLDDDCVLDSTPWAAELDRVAVVEDRANTLAGTECHYSGAAPFGTNGVSIGPEGPFLPGHVFRNSLCDGTASSVAFSSDEASWNIGLFDVTLDDTPGAPNKAGYISIAAGGNQTLALTGGTPGNVYWILGSASGTTPGLPGPPAFPLNFDGYLLFTITNPNSLFIDSVALLGDRNGDGVGDAAAILDLPPGITITPPVTLSHAWFEFDLVTAVSRNVSNAVSLELIP